MAEEQKTRDSKGKFLPGYKPPKRDRKGTRNRISKPLFTLMAKEAPAIIEAMVEAAKGGDTQAAKIVLAQVLPNTRTGKIRLLLPAIDGMDSVVEASAAIIDAVGKGDICLDHGDVLQRLLTSHQGMLESHDFEKRLAEIERFHNSTEVS